MIFLNDIHENNYMELARKTNLHPDDSERKALFYIIAVTAIYIRKNFSFMIS